MHFLVRDGKENQRPCYRRPCHSSRGADRGFRPRPVSWARRAPESERKTRLECDLGAAKELEVFPRGQVRVDRQFLGGLTRCGF